MAYTSRSLTTVEPNYAQIAKEMLAIVFRVESCLLAWNEQGH